MLLSKKIVADTPDSAHDAAVKLAEETGTEWFVVKAQIHAVDVVKEQLQKLVLTVLC